ncbi:type II toxin-antitoxin system RelE/ParE family toxin [Salegentibacter echinorum]|uniref:type II toxin-antitoxin system RelE/ParE family toxin n=1 Tax=Salegentibacter echinorum TaxID=1073325 RepID=UPI001114EB39
MLDHLKENWGKNVTQSFVSKTFDMLALLKKQPNLGTLENPKKGIRGFLISKHNIMFYRVDEDVLIVLNFFDTRSSISHKRY